MSHGRYTWWSTASGLSYCGWHMGRTWSAAPEFSYNWLTHGANILEFSSLVGTWDEHGRHHRRLVHWLAHASNTVGSI